MTTYGGVTLAVEALKRGAMDFVLKPWRNEELIAAVTPRPWRAHARGTRRPHARLETLERRRIEQALERHQGNIFGPPPGAGPDPSGALPAHVQAWTAELVSGRAGCARRC